MSSPGFRAGRLRRRPRPPRPGDDMAALGQHQHGGGRARAHHEAEGRWPHLASASIDDMRRPSPAALGHVVPPPSALVRRGCGQHHEGRGRGRPARGRGRRPSPPVPLGLGPSAAPLDLDLMSTHPLPITSQPQPIISQPPSAHPLCQPLVSLISSAFVGGRRPRVPRACTTGGPRRVRTAGRLTPRAASGSLVRGLDRGGAGAPAPASDGRRGAGLDERAGRRKLTGYGPARAIRYVMSEAAPIRTPELIRCVGALSFEYGSGA